MASTEQFTEALQLTHSSSVSVCHSDRLLAEQYLMTLRDSTEGLNLSFYIITNEPVNDLRYFWAFSTIRHHIASIALTVNDQQADELYRSLFSCIHRYLFASPSSTPADYVLNKHAQLMVTGLRHFFPNRWNNVFTDLFDLLERGRAAPASVQDSAMTYFLRVFEYIDEQVVNVRDQPDRPREQRALDMQIKDAMREGVIPRVVQTWFDILSESRCRAAETANLCLSVIQLYVEWIDVTLVITAEWMNLLHFLLTMPPVRVAACECLLSLITKKQLTGMKLASLAALNVVEALPRLLSLLTVPPVSDEDVAFFDVVARLSVSVSEQFLSLLETCGQQLHAHLTPGTGLNGNQDVITMQENAAGGGIVQDRPYQLSQALVDQLATSLHGCVNQVLQLLRVAPADSCDTLLTFFQLYSKSVFMSESETMQLLLVTFSMSKIRDLAENETRIWDDVVIDQRRTLYTLLRLLHRRSPSLVFEYAYNLQQRLVLVWSQPASAQNAVQPINAVSRSSGSRLAAAGFTASAAAKDVPAQLGSQTNNSPAPYPSSLASHNNNNENANANLSTSASLLNFSETDGYDGNGRGNGSPDGAFDSGSGARLLHQIGMSLEDPQNFRDPSVVEAVLRFVYEVGESVKMEVLRDEKDAFTQMIEQLVSCEPLVGTEQTNSCVHLTFFELIDRYVVFFQYHSELLPVLLHRLLLLPGGVMNRNDRVRARVDYLFSHLLQVLRSCLYPYAADVVTALQSILSTTRYLLSDDRQQLFEAIGTLLSIALTPPNAGISGSSGTRAVTGASVSTRRAADAMIGETNRDLPEDIAEQQRYIQSVMDDLVQPVIDASVRRLGCSAHQGHTDCAVCRGQPLCPQATPEMSVAESISCLSAVAKGLNSSAAAASSLSASPTSTTNAGGGLQASFHGASTSAAATAAANTLVAQRFCVVTAQVLRVMNDWQSCAVVRDAGSQFFQQMVNTIPYDLLEPYYEVFVEQSLSWMFAVSELSRLLRLMFQSVNKAGARCLAGVARLTPLVWEKTAQLGSIDEEGSMVHMGVLSETAREKVDVYRQLFTYIFNIATWGSAPGLLLLPHTCLGAIVEALVSATALPTELELPRAALQTLTKLTQELIGVSDALVEELTSRHLPDGAAHSQPVDGGGSPSATLIALSELVRSTPDPAATQRQITQSEAYLTRFLLDKVVPSVLRVLVEPSFNLRDAKNLSVAIGETGQLCKALIARLGEAAMQSIYSVLAPLVGNDEAMAFCTTLRDQPKLNSALKLKFRDMLIRAQVQYARTPLR